MVRIVIIFFIIFSLNINAEELNNQELAIFKFLDLNNDNYISEEEISQSSKFIFQLIDINKDNKLSHSEIIELKKIIDLLK